MSLVGKVILLDPGHGGEYEGATWGDNIEKEITLDMANRVRNHLIGLGATVFQIRLWDRDYGGTTIDDDINKRVEYINKGYPGGYDALVSLHCNSPWGGSGSFYYNGSQTSSYEKMISKQLALEISRAAFQHYGALTGNFAILRDTNDVAAKVLVEMASIADVDWDRDSYKSVLAHDIALGIDRYFNSDIVIA
ncbi:N-acetylmuramoyl-L-alanine amidase family protein [Ornithinibacillus halophilus]|uniref:N-acetylmuramoyl-L-alanine amidase n=1 Tax=Ornithinibacillus halophilus TaxID=930117 RepID=A0A1M5I4Q7_9BACI|nr:N-acetylmuramoyl-L-alanine amidase [Ornithinibacillus halophilus]SHG23252.1 N-acetylmuramoyl-L-alanine amidase [Ornithinibacillus halophilus]